MRNMPRILPLVGIAIGGVLAINAVSGAAGAPDLLSGAGPNGGGTDSFASREGVAEALSRLGVNEIERRTNAIRDYFSSQPGSNGNSVTISFNWAEGRIETAIGSLTRAGGIAVQAKVGDPVCQGDVIETAVDGGVGLRFIDGTRFKLSSSARMVLDEFVCDGNGTSHSSLFGVTRGTFAFIVGQLSETGSRRIMTWT